MSNDVNIEYDESRIDETVICGSLLDALETAVSAMRIQAAIEVQVLEYGAQILWVRRDRDGEWAMVQTY